MYPFTTIKNKLTAYTSSLSSSMFGDCPDRNVSIMYVFMALVETGADKKNRLTAIRYVDVHAVCVYHISTRY